MNTKTTASESFYILAARETYPDWFSRQLMRYMKSAYSHVLISRGDEHLYHATGEGFHRIDYADFVKDHLIVERFEVPLRCSPAEATMWLEAMSKMEIEYGIGQYLGFLFPPAKSFFRNRRTKTICSEICGDFLIDCSTVTDIRLGDCDFISPTDLVDIMQSYEKRVRDSCIAECHPY